MKVQLTEIIKKQLSNYNNKKFSLLNEADDITAHCTQNQWLQPLTSEEISNIPKDENGKIVFCKYMGVRRPLYLPVGTTDFKANIFSNEKRVTNFIDQLTKENKIESPSNISSESLISNLNTLGVSPSSLGSFTLPNGAKYQLSIVTEDLLKTINNYGYYRDKVPYVSPDFSNPKYSIASGSLTLKQVFDLYRSDENTWNERIESNSGWQKYWSEEDGEFRENTPSWAKTAKELFEKRQVETQKTQENDTLDFMFFNLFKDNLPTPITYVKKDGTRYELPAGDFDTIPEGFLENRRDWGVEYGGGKTNPPDKILIELTDSFISTTIPAEEATGNSEFDDKYKRYYSPYEIKQRFKEIIDNSGVSILAIINNVNKDNIYTNPIIKRLYTEQEVKTALNDDKCDGAIDFLQKITKGELYNREKQRVGFYYLKGNQPTLARWDGGYAVLGRTDAIPCGTEFWEDYGATIQISLITISIVVTSVLSAGGATVIWTAVGADIIGNAWAMYFDAKKQDSGMVAMDAAFCLLAPLFEIPGVKFALTRLAVGKNLVGALDEVMAAFKVAEQNKYTAQQIETMIKNFTEKQKAALSLLDDSLMRQPIREGAEHLTKELIESAKNLGVRRARKYIPVAIEIFSNLAVAGGFLLSQFLSQLEDRYKSESGRDFTEMQRKTWASYLANLDERNANLFLTQMLSNPGLLTEITNSAEFEGFTESQKKLKEAYDEKKKEEEKKVIQQVVSDEELKRRIDEANSYMNSLNETIKNGVKNRQTTGPTPTPIQLMKNPEKGKGILKSGTMTIEKETQDLNPKDQSEGDSFRKWMKENHSDFRCNNDTLSDKEGMSFVNSCIKLAWATYKTEYRDYILKNKELESFKEFVKTKRPDDFDSLIFKVIVPHKSFSYTDTSKKEFIYNYNVTNNKWEEEISSSEKTTSQGGRPPKVGGE